MTTERFLNTYHNARTAPSAEVPADLAGFMLAADLFSLRRRSLLGYLRGLIREWPRIFCWPEVAHEFGELELMGSIVAPDVLLHDSHDGSSREIPREPEASSSGVPGCDDFAVW